jgi:hypothetical protein
VSIHGAGVGRPEAWRVLTRYEAMAGQMPDIGQAKRRAATAPNWK